METQSLNSSSFFVLPEGLESAVQQGDILPRWFLWTYIAVFEVVGLVSNGVLAGYLFRRNSFPIVLHLCFADIATLLFVAPYEVLVLADSAGTWLFPQEFCPIFLGFEVLFGTVTIYIIIVLNFSSAIRSQNSSLMIPLLTVWLIATSLSIPDFIFGEVITPRHGYNICCLPKRAAFLISSFRLVLPVFLLIVGTIIIVSAFLFKAQRDNSLRLALVLSVTYIALSVQRSVFGIMHGILFTPVGPTRFRTPPLADITETPTSTLSLALFHYTLSAVRPFISWSVSADMQPNIVRVPRTNQVA